MTQLYIASWCRLSKELVDTLDKTLYDSTEIKEANTEEDLKDDKFKATPRLFEGDTLLASGVLAIKEYLKENYKDATSKS